MARGIKCPKCGHNAFKMAAGDCFECLWCGTVFPSQPQPIEPNDLQASIEHLREEARAFRVRLERSQKRLAELERKIATAVEPIQPSEPNKDNSRRH